MAISSEEQRALDFQRTLINRERAQRVAERKLRGNPTRHRQLLDAWGPVIHREEDFRPGERLT